MVVPGAGLLPNRLDVGVATVVEGVPKPGLADGAPNIDDVAGGVAAAMVEDVGDLNIELALLVDAALKRLLGVLDGAAKRDDVEVPNDGFGARDRMNSYNGCCVGIITRTGGLLKCSKSVNTM